MKLYSETTDFKLYEGSMLDMLQVLNPCTVDSVVTDPPYELGFMGKGWDSSGIAFQADTWRKCFSVLKSGGYLLAFGGSRTYHRIACAIEDAGFEIRDCIMWLYGSGFPKSMNIGLAIDKKNGVESIITGYTDQQDIRGGNYCNNQEKRLMHPVRQAQNEWDGWGTALKPAYEPIIVARKPCEGSCVDNVIRYGTGGLNIDGCRIGTDVITTNGARKNPMAGDERTGKALGMFQETEALNTDHNGRFPSNVILTYDETDREEVCGGMPETKSVGGEISMPLAGGGDIGVCNFATRGADRVKTDYVAPADEGSAARYFYTAKASKRDRDEGLDSFVETQITDGNLRCNAEFAPNMRAVSALHRNTHPTVKPTDLMQYLVRLVTPPNGTVLDPFNGSGSTGKAVMYENKDRNACYKYIGIELTAEYLPIADARIRYAAGDNRPVEPKDTPLQGQINIFDILGDNNNG